MPRARLLGVVAVAVGFLAGCGRSQAGALDPAGIPVVEIGFEGQTNTFPYPGGIVPSLIRATISDANGQNARSWSASASMLESIKADAVGYVPPTSRTRFSFSAGNRMLNVPLYRASVDPPGVQIVSAPWGGTLILNQAGADRLTWVEMSVVFDDGFEGGPDRVDATYGFWLHSRAP